MEVFTPMSEDRSVRLQFDGDSVKLVSGSLGSRKLGYQATVTIAGHRFRIHGISCGIPHCHCDARIVYVGES